MPKKLLYTHQMTASSNAFMHEKWKNINFLEKNTCKTLKLPIFLLSLPRVRETFTPFQIRIVKHLQAYIQNFKTDNE